MDKSARCLAIDLEWADNRVMPEVVTPEVEFMFQRMIDVTLAEVDVKEGELVLDVGCGRGFDGVRMAGNGGFVIGVEPSSVMLRYARAHIAKNCVNMTLVRGIGENLPFRMGCMDKVVCKGALDHFIDPLNVLGEMARVLKSGGQAVIAVANFGSLGFMLGRAVHFLRRGVSKTDGGLIMPWETPPDHTYRFDYKLLAGMLRRYFKVDKVRGVSLLFGLPWWGDFLAKCPKKISRFILALLDKVAHYLPRLSDVIVVKCTLRDPVSK